MWFLIKHSLPYLNGQKHVFTVEYARTLSKEVYGVVYL